MEGETHGVRITDQVKTINIGQGNKTLALSSNVLQCILPFSTLTRYLEYVNPIVAKEK